MEKTDLAKRYRELWDDYVNAMYEQWDKETSGHWVETSSMGLWAMEDGAVLSCFDIKYIVDDNVTYEEFWDWREYNDLCRQLGMNVNLVDFRKKRELFPKQKLEAILEFKKS